MPHLSPHITTPIGEISWIDEELEMIYVKFFQGDTDAGLEGAKEYLRLLKLHFQKENRGLFIISDLRGVKQADKESREFFTSSEAVQVCRATAILIDSSLSRIIGNLFLLFNKPSYPTKLFVDKQKAIDWLKQQ